jgi:hypothetical protein
MIAGRAVIEFGDARGSLYFWVVPMKQQMVLVYSVARSVSAAIGQWVVKSVGQLTPEEIAGLEQHLCQFPPSVIDLSKKTGLLLLPITGSMNRDYRGRQDRDCNG